jgi:hypothetical protein
MKRLNILTNSDYPRQLESMCRAVNATVMGFYLETGTNKPFRCNGAAHAEEQQKHYYFFNLTL